MAWDFGAYISHFATYYNYGLLIFSISGTLAILFYALWHLVCASLLKRGKSAIDSDVCVYILFSVFLIIILESSKELLLRDTTFLQQLIALSILAEFTAIWINKKVNKL